MENLPKIVRARLQRPAPSTADLHPDADLLTAFAEHSLAAGERDQVLEHLARCSDCRDVVALALPAPEPAALTPSHRPARIGWLSLPVLRWGVVAAGIALVTSVGILQYRQRHQEKTLVATSLISRGQSADSALQNSALSPSAAASQPVAPQTESAKRTGLAKQTEMAKKAPVPSPSRPENSLAVNKPLPAPKAIFPRPEPMRRSTSVGAVHGATSGYGFSSSAGRSSNAVQVSPQHNAEPAPADQLQIVDKAKPASPQASSALVPAPLLHTEPTVMKGSSVPRWTISAGGALQRSLDGGKTWLDVDIAVNDSVSANLLRLPNGMNTSTVVEVTSAAPEVQTETQTESKTQPKSEPKFAAKSAAKSMARSSVPSNVKSAQVPPAPPPLTIFRAVSVSSDATEVWAGGSGGALFHTVDAGNRWSRVVPYDAGIVLTGDVIRIQFSDPRDGIVTTSNAEVWTTLDAGQTWHKRQ
jgi:hypothetical protein